MRQPQQRVDIADVVEGFLEQQGDQEAAGVLESRTRRKPLKAQRASPIEPVPSADLKSMPSVGDTWYVVIDEIVESTVSFEAWPWPNIDTTTRFLSFDLSQTRRKVVDRDDLQRIVDHLRAERDQSPTADRPLRIGDVFEVAARNIRNPGTWTSVIDDTLRKRKEAQAALHAMAAPPHFATSGELEAIGNELQQSSRRQDASLTKTFPAV